MDTNLARRITALVDEINDLDDSIGLDDVNTPEVISRFAQRQRQAKAELDVLIVTAQRQLVIDVAREATLESYRR